MPQINTWLYAEIIWVVAFIWALVTVFLWLRSKRRISYGINGATKIEIIESKYFLREDAQEIYEKVNSLMTELIKIAPLIHKDYAGQPDRLTKFADDKRYKNILSRIAVEREKCADLKFDKWLGSYVALMAKFAYYSDNPYKGDALRLFNRAHEQIRNYMNTKLRSREKWKISSGKTT